MENSGFASGQNASFQQPPMNGQSQGLAIASLVCGILSCLCCISILTGPAGLIMGFIAKKKADENPLHFGGRGLAVAGMITGGVGTALVVVIVILQIFFGVLGSLMKR